MICSQAIVSARAQDLLRLPESMTIIKNRTDTRRFSFPLLNKLSTARGNDRLVVFHLQVAIELGITPKEILDPIEIHI